MPEQIIECTSACTVTVVHQFNLPVLELSSAEGAAIAAAVLAIWAVGFGFRALIQAVRSSDSVSTSEN